MILYFKNSSGKMRRIEKIDGRKNRSEIAKEINNAIYDFCTNHNYKIYYVRIWDESYKGKLMTKFDVGSHTEFFYTYPSSMDCFAEDRYKP